MRFLSFLLCQTLLFCGVAAAFTLPQPSDTFHHENRNRWQLFAGTEYSDYFSNTQGKSFVVDSVETDSLEQFSHAHNLGSLLGMQRILKHQRGRSSIALGVTIYYNTADFTGEVRQFEDPDLNNYTYSYRAKPIDSVFETTFFLPIQSRCLKPYFLAGAGISSIYLDYEDTPKPGVPAGSGLVMTQWRALPVVEVGAGLQLNVDARFFISTRYAYQYRGTTIVTGSGITGRIPINLNMQKVDLIAGFRF